MKKIIRLIVRKIIGAREHETISDAFDRKKHKILKIFNKKEFTKEDLEKKIIALGLKNGDIVIVHASWRSFIGYIGNPQDVIDSIKKIVGKEGTIIMPSYTINKDVFNYNDPTSAGYIAETFRKNKNVYRSLNNVFSFCAYGKDAKSITEKHIVSKYPFDENSPYYLAMKKNAKVLLLGLGKKPHKITLFHAITFSLKTKMNIYKNIYNTKKSGIIYDESGKKIITNYCDKDNKYQNDKNKFKKLFLKNISNKNYNRINYLDIYLFDEKKIFEDSRKFIIENNYNIYKN